MRNFDDEPKKPSAPTMSRSRGQLASAYAPGAFFTFEGGLGSCIAIPDRASQADIAHLSGPVQTQVLTRLDEAVSSWFDRAYNCRPPDAKNPVKAPLCVDRTLLDDQLQGIQPVDRGRFIFLNPTRMGYAPAPLSFVCNHCGLFRYFKDVKEFQRKKHLLSNSPCRAEGHQHCQWRQLDVIFVHWSGHWEPVMPGKYDWDNEKHSLREPINRCPQCHGENFFLNTSSPSIGKWFFKCANPACGNIDPSSWLKNDPKTIEVLRDEFPKRITEARMEPVSYRASAAFYAHSEQFILFANEQDELLKLMDPSKAGELAGFIAERFGYGQARPSLAEIEKELKQRSYESEWTGYCEQKAVLDAAKKVMAGLGASGEAMRPAITQLEKNLQEKIDGWFKGNPSLLKETNELPDAVQALLRNRSEFSSRYDPFRLAVEHEALKRYKLTAPRLGSGRRPFVRFDTLDNDLAPHDSDEQQRQEAATRQLLQRLGIETMGLIREFDLCRFTYGYSRMQAVPKFQKRNDWMPVKLNLFPTVRDEGGARHPVYVITQANEAIYVQLNQAAVYKWLQQLNPADMFEWDKNSGRPLGAYLLERSIPFGRYLDGVKARGPAFVYFYVYTLLHTYSHVLMKAIAEHSGLDVGSLGEYLFPADLAFVVYRNGTTMDLGNLSALWRNENERFLRHLLEPKTLICNSGSLCDANPKNPGACPDCILVPETSCIAMNQLLSRSVLRGGPAPREDGEHQERIPGFLQVVNGVV